MKRLLKQMIAKHRKVLLGQVLAVNGLMQLLMKGRNGPAGWTREELLLIRAHLKAMARLVPILIVFLLPGGLLLLPILAEVLDRRGSRR
ncbi:MAG: hypothetical protein ACE147_13810 [Candidatus Methylomirabilales bacterium]